MGYDVIYENGFSLNKKLSKKMAKFLLDFSSTRHYRRNLIGYGLEGEFYLDPADTMCENMDRAFKTGKCDRQNVNYILDTLKIIDYNHPPMTQPGLWCQWISSEDRTQIVWDGNEKFYNGCEWMQYIIDNFLLPNGYSIIDGSTRVLDEGVDTFEFEDDDDIWTNDDTGDWYNAIMSIKDNKVYMQYRT